MSKLFDFSGDDDFFPGLSVYPNPKESSLFSPIGHHVDVYFPLVKRSRISAPFVFDGSRFEQREEASIEVLPDECLFEIFRRLPGGEERNICACISKRWLMLLSSIRGNEFCSTRSSQVLKPEDDVTKEKVEDEDESDGYLSRTLEGKKATDVKLAAIAVGTASLGGLGKLSIRGSNHSHKVTDLGLKAVARGCPSLRALTLWNVSSVGDEGLGEIAKGCQLLEKLDLGQCPAISDKALLELAKNCPSLTDITLDSCLKIGNEGLQALGQYCPNLKSIAVKDCPLVGDQGIVSLFCSTSNVLNKVKLQALNISDVSLCVIGHYGKSLTDLVLTGLTNVSERGLWVMGNGHGLQKLKSFTIISCRGVTDTGLEAVGRGCPNLKKFRLHKCSFVSDSGLVSFAKAARSLECLHLEECHRITQFRFFAILLNGGAKLKALSLVNCFGIKDMNLNIPMPSSGISLQSLSIHNCPGFGNGSLALLGKMCPQLQHVDFSGLEGITDSGILSLLDDCEAGLVKINLSGCVNLTDKVVSSITELHGWTLELLNLNGCKNITDASLIAIAENCPLLSDLDISKSAITDFGIAALAQANLINLQILAVSGCYFVSDKSFYALQKLGETLVRLNIQNCYSIKNSTIDLLVGKLWRCDILS